MVLAVFVSVLLDFVKSIDTVNLEGHIVRGNLSKIEDFAYAAFLHVECQSEEHVHNFICGGSIVNQMIILTAAHCLHGCGGRSNYTVHVGSVHRSTGVVYAVSKFIIHPDYNPQPVDNDIAVMKLASRLTFGKTVKRVSLMKQPPYFELAFVAGWGLTDENTKSRTKLLLHTSQTVWTRQRCLEVLPRVPDGAFCAGSKCGASYASFGDSGSALVVRKYIQIGLVSFKSTHISRSLVVYTDVGYFYDWIKEQSRALYCSKN